jgi:hypothetical protein
MDKRVMKLAVIVIAVGVLVCSANGQAVSLQEQLNAQYKLVKMGSDSGGIGVVEPGTLLAVQKGGIISVPWKALALCPAKYKDGTLHPSVGFCANMVRQVSRYFKVGEKVYPTKVEVNFDKAKITLTVVACDSCNGVNPPSSMKGEVNFEFAKGYLEKANAGEVEDTIGQVFSISSDDQQQSQGGNDNSQQQNQQQGNQQQGNQQAQPQQQSEPQTVQMGMTTDQVQNILGRPEKIFNLGPKQIFVYKDVKVTFQNNQVVDVQ